MIGGSIPSKGWEFSIYHQVHTGSGAHPHWVPGVLYLGLKRPGRESDHSGGEIKECVEL